MIFGYNRRITEAGFLEMKIKEIKVAAFKSFKEPATIPCHKGITTFTGECGVGKTNLLTAILWAFGETSEEVLHCHSTEYMRSICIDDEGEPPATEVTVRLADPPGGKSSEVFVSSRLNPENKTEYFLDETPCVHRDVQNILANGISGASCFSYLKKAVKEGDLLLEEFKRVQTPILILDEPDSNFYAGNIDSFVEMITDIKSFCQVIMAARSNEMIAASDLVHKLTVDEYGFSNIVPV